MLDMTISLVFGWRSQQTSYEDAHRQRSKLLNSDAITIGAPKTPDKSMKVLREEHHMEENIQKQDLS